MQKYEVSKEENIITFVRDHGECYGGVRKTYIDTEGKTGSKLYAHIKEYAGAALAEAARKKGFC